MITGQVKDLCYGLYGKTAVPINPEVQKKALKGYERGEEPITCRPAEVLEPELEKAKAEIGDWPWIWTTWSLYAMYPVTGKKFLQWKYGKEEPPAEVNEVGVDEVGGSPVLSYIQQMPAGPMMMPAAAPAPAAKPAPAPAAEAPATAAAAAPAAAPAAAEEVAGTPLKAPMPGMIVKYQKSVGDAVTEGETVVVLEAMKMENALPATVGGTIKAVNFASGDSVAKGDVLCVIG
jgi:pyruvate carboxylase subunit B